MENDLVKFDELRERIGTFLAPVDGILVRDKTENAAAKGALVTVKGLGAEIEAVRDAAVRPLNDRVKLINARAKEITAPLAAAEAKIKKVMKDFADAENARIEAERKKAEEAAEAERKRLEEKRRAEQAEADRIAREAREKLEAEEKERKAKLEQEERARNAFGVKSDAELAEAKRLEDKAAQDKKDELERKLAKDKADADARARREAADLERRNKSTTKSFASQRVAGTRTVWKYEITEALEVPMEYWMIDETKLGAAVRGGARDIPGVRIYSEQAVVAGG